MTAGADRLSTGAVASPPWIWDASPLVCGLLIALCVVYLAGMLRLASERRLPTAALSRGLAYGAGIAMLILALLSPLDAWGDQVFAAHMAQHLILMMLAPPLLILGRPVVVGLWALPRNGRHAVAGWWKRSRAVRPVVDWFLSPLVAWLAASAVLWFWHLPKPYGLAFAEPIAHALEHLSFFLTSILFWRVVIADPQSRRLSLGATMIFVMTFAMENAMLAAILIFAPMVLYSVHAVAPEWSPLTPIEDQQLAGVLMWSVTGVVDLVAAGWLFVTWLASSERRTQRG
ncbi:MAG: cytochrome c oxidase assembly protein [Burkholderiaceae bacterium]